MKEIMEQCLFLSFLEVTRPLSLLPPAMLSTGHSILSLEMFTIVPGAVMDQLLAYWDFLAISKSKSLL